MKDIKDKDLREMRRIQASIPEDLKKRLVRKVKVTPTMSKAIDLVLKQDLTKEQREKFENIKKSGILEQKEEVVNKSVERAVDQYVTAEMLKSIRAGRLSKPEKGTLLSKFFNYD
jgi:hypothetical protein